MNQALLRGFAPPHTLSEMAESTSILVALSGGADSAALLFLLKEYARKSGAPLAVAHVDHKLRGKASDADREFCRALAEQYGLPFYLLEADVAALAEERHCGIEEQARKVRYDFFESVMREHRIPILATAHNADDNAETVLFHITRGSGLRGLCGIPPKRPLGDGLLIRPLLQVTKADILAFCEQNHIEYVTDGTNSDVTYARNRIRHHVLPQLAAINSGVLGNVSRLCTAVSRDEELLTRLSADFLEKHARGNRIATDLLAAEHPAIVSRAVASLLSRVTDDVRAVHIDAVLELAASGTAHASLDLGNGATASIEGGDLVIGLPDRTSPSVPYFHHLHEGENLIPEADMLILIEKETLSHKNQETFKNIYKKATTTRISSATIYDSFTVEPRRPGDVILCGGMHKKVKKLLCEHKLPLPLRDRLPIFRDSHGIVWIPEVALRDGASEGDDRMTITLFYNN